MLNLSMTNVKSAIVSGVITAILAGASYIIGLNDVFAIDVHALINVISLAGMTAIVSLIKSLLTTDSGSFAGVTKIK